MSMELLKKIAKPPTIMEGKHDNVFELFKDIPINQELVHDYRNRRIVLCIGTTCTLKCPYCVSNMFLPATQQCETVVEKLGVDEYLKRVLYISKPFVPNVSFTISGGEPTENPAFVQIATELFKTGANIALQSNLHGIANIERFTAPFLTDEIHRRVKAIVSYHCGTYIDMGETGKALRKRWITEWLPRALATGIDIQTVVVPLTPKVLRDPDFITEYETILKVAKCNPAVSELFHFYEEKHYPESYTPEETKLLAKIQQHFKHDATGNVCKSEAKKMQYLTNFIEVKGAHCAAPVNNIEILMDGCIRMCQSFPQETTSYGLIQDPQFYEKVVHFTENPLPCPADQCLCRSFGVYYCLQIHGISLDQYYNAWYADQNKPEVAKLFE